MGSSGNNLLAEYSGSVVTTLDTIVVGLLFASSSVATFVNQIRNVSSLLQLEVAEEIL